MNNYRDIIKAPIITEKSSNLAANNVITFSVDIRANKTQIKQAIEKIFDVKVESVEKVEEWKDKIDVMILCGGSATDLPEQGPRLFSRSWYRLLD